MKCILSLPFAALKENLSSMKQREQFAMAELGINNSNLQCHFIARNIVTKNTIGKLDTIPYLFMRVMTSTFTKKQCLVWLQTLVIKHTEPVVGIYLSKSELVEGVVLFPNGESRNINQLCLVGAGMHKLSVGQVKHHNDLDDYSSVRWSRVIGALSLPVLDRMRHLKFAIIGAGRNGSLMATSIAQLGVKNIDMIDPDNLELHNTDAMDGVTESGVGKAKVDLISKSLHKKMLMKQNLRPLAVSAQSIMGLQAIRQTDFVVVCVDNDGARFYATLMAHLYGKPLLDVGSGVFGKGLSRQMGGDIRLILPGEGRCLCCVGGLQRTEHLKALLWGLHDKQVDWQEQRAGSLRSLNQINVHLGLRLIEDLVGERIDQSTWIRFETGINGIPRIESIPMPISGQCNVCGLSGLGKRGEIEVKKGINQLILSLCNE